jgi:hypothetical protein
MECGHLTDDWGEREGEREILPVSGFVETLLALVVIR